MQEKRIGPPCPSEDVEQIQLFNWAALASGKYPELSLMFHIPNGGSRNKAEAAKLKVMGVKSGVPDICLPVPRGDYHGLFIELKKQRGGKLSLSQDVWLTALSTQGYCAITCKGFDHAQRAIINYLEEKI